MRKDILLRKEEILKWINENQSKYFISKQLKCNPDTLNRWLYRMDIKYNGNKPKKGFSKGRKNAMYYINTDKFINTHILKKKLLEDEIKEYVCEKCNCTTWFGYDIPLELHHKDGDRYNNKLYNLQLLCPNCHSLEHKDDNTNKTDKKLNYLDDEIKELKKIEYFKESRNNYKKRKSNKIEKKYKKIKIKKINYCECGKIIHRRSKTCEECYYLNERKVKDRPTKEELLHMVKEYSYVQVGKKYGVSDNAIRKWLK